MDPRRRWIGSVQTSPRRGPSGKTPQIEALPCALPSPIRQRCRALVNGHGHDVTRASLFIESHERRRIKMLGLPKRNDIFVPDFRGVTKIGNVEGVGLPPRGPFLKVHVAAVPAIVCAGDHRVHAPVHENAELGIAKPIGALVFFERFPGWLIRALGHLFATARDSQFSMAFLPPLHIGNLAKKTLVENEGGRN